MASRPVGMQQFAALTADELGAYAQARADALGLTVSAAHRPGVLDNLAILQTHAAILASRLEGDRSRRPGP